MAMSHEIVLRKNRRFFDKLAGPVRTFGIIYLVQTSLHQRETYCGPSARTLFDNVLEIDFALRAT